MAVAVKKIKTNKDAIGQMLEPDTDSVLFHRSRARIREFGEVFTPELCVSDMLKLISRDNKGLWSNENIRFFEPCCGHGNIVTVIYRKRLEGLYKKARRLGRKKPVYHAVANAINTLWAIDIDPCNVIHTKMRILGATLEFIKEKTEISNNRSHIAAEAEFFAHLFCAINWHVHENETLSSLSDAENAQTNADKTKLGHQWILKNGHRPIDFNTSWTDHFLAQQENKLVPFIFKRSTRLVKNILAGNGRLDAEFEFADYLICKPEPVTKQRTRNKKRATG